MDELVPRAYPPITEIPILRRSEGHIEPSDGAEEIGLDGQIIGCKELEFAIRRKELVHGSVHDHLARSRVSIAGQAVGRAASDQSLRRLLERLGESIEPARIR